MFKSILLQILLPLFPTDSLLANYKSDTSYVLQEIVYGVADVYPNFAGVYRLKTDLTNSFYQRYQIFYISNEKYILNAIKTDSLNLDSVTILVPSHACWCIYDSLSGLYKDRISYVKDVYDIMTLDDTEIYKIGNKYYVIRKIKYGYLDNIELYRSLYCIKSDAGSDIQFEKEESYYRNTYKTLREYLQTENYRYFLFLQELYPTDELIKTHVWKKRYELDEFWYKNLGKDKE